MVFWDELAVSQVLHAVLVANVRLPLHRQVLLHPSEGIEQGPSQSSLAKPCRAGGSDRCMSRCHGECLRTLGAQLTILLPAIDSGVWGKHLVDRTR